MVEHWPFTNTVDPHDLARFVEAQEYDYVRALAELRSGQQRSHWLWYIFPQFDGLGLSSISRRYSIKSVEAAATLFARVSAAGSVFEQLLDRYFSGEPDDRTVRLLERR